MNIEIEHENRQKEFLAQKATLERIQRMNLQKNPESWQNGEYRSIFWSKDSREMRKNAILAWYGLNDKQKPSNKIKITELIVADKIKIKELTELISFFQKTLLKLLK